ncbi:hypothetical protein NIES208_00090 [[Limnothrix rosea] IAM M-220]|nr:hypothetical protein NIES208_00090 [[Limnothrix rosea] IAM M-220]
MQDQNNLIHLPQSTLLRIHQTLNLNSLSRKSFFYEKYNFSGSHVPNNTGEFKKAVKVKHFCVADKIMIGEKTNDSSQSKELKNFFCKNQA